MFLTESVRDYSEPELQSCTNAVGSVHTQVSRMLHGGSAVRWPWLRGQHMNCLSAIIAIWGVLFFGSQWVCQKFLPMRLLDDLFSGSEFFPSSTSQMASSCFALPRDKIGPGLWRVGACGAEPQFPLSCTSAEHCTLCSNVRVGPTAAPQELVISAGTQEANFLGNRVYKRKPRFSQRWGGSQFYWLRV